MLVKILTGDLHGVDAYRVVVEVDVTRQGMPGLNLVGLPSASVTEGKVRVRAALLNAGFKLDSRRMIVNLAPAEMRKDTAAFDLPIALGILGGYELIPAEALAGVMAVGELALDGGLRPVSGVLPVADLAQRLGVRTLIVPADSGSYRIRSVAPANSAGSPGGTIKPAPDSPIASRLPPTSVSTCGTPAAKASRTTFENPSR